MTASGISPLHFGIVASVNSDIRNVIPPFGLNIFVATGAFQKSYVDVVKAILPWVFLSIISLVIVTYIPEISLRLPKRMYPGIKIRRSREDRYLIWMTFRVERPETLPKSSASKLREKENPMNGTPREIQEELFYFVAPR